MASATPIKSSARAATDPIVGQARIDLAAALRWAVRLGLSEGVDNHFSMAVPGPNGKVEGDRFLINPYGWHWSEITASSLVLADDKGNVLEGSNDIEDSAFFIHSRVHVQVPSARVVLHNHMPYTTALTLLQDGRLEMCEQNALQFDGRIAYDDEYNGLALDSNEGDRIAGKMGESSILFMACHGVIVTGESVARAFTDLYYLERASMFQVLARSTGGNLRQISDSVREATRGQMDKELPLIAERHFSALRRILDREEPDYRS